MNCPVFIRFRQNCWLKIYLIWTFYSVVKYFCCKHGISGSGPGSHLNSYSVVLMVMFFLQKMQQIPSIETLQSNVTEDLCERWNFAFNRDFVNVSNGVTSMTIGNLLKEFFLFYWKFPYETQTICPLVGRPVKKYNMKYGLNLPKVLEDSPHFGKHKEKLELNKPLVIQDPFELTRNVTGPVDASHLGRICFFHETFFMFIIFFEEYMTGWFERAHRLLREKQSLVQLFNFYNEELEAPSEKWDLRSDLKLFDNTDNDNNANISDINDANDFNEQDVEFTA